MNKPPKKKTHRKRTHDIKVRLNDDEYNYVKNKVRLSRSTMQNFIIHSIYQATIYRIDNPNELVEVTRLLNEIIFLLREISQQLQILFEAKSESLSTHSLTSIANDIDLIKKGGNDSWQLLKSLMEQNRQIPR